MTVIGLVLQALLASGCFAGLPEAEDAQSINKRSRRQIDEIDNTGLPFMRRNMDEIDNTDLPFQNHFVRRNMDEIDNTDLPFQNHFVRRNMDEIDNTDLPFQNHFVRRNMDEIDNTDLPFHNHFVRRNMDEIDNTGMDFIRQQARKRYGTFGYQYPGTPSTKPIPPKPRQKPSPPANKPLKPNSAAEAGRRFLIERAIMANKNWMNDPKLNPIVNHKSPMSEKDRGVLIELYVRYDPGLKEDWMKDKVLNPVIDPDVNPWPNKKDFPEWSFKSIYAK